MKKYFILFSLVFFSFSCREKKYTQYYDNGNIYLQVDTILNSQEYKSDTILGYYKYKTYYYNGALRSKGQAYLPTNKAFGEWTFLFNDGDTLFHCNYEEGIATPPDKSKNIIDIDDVIIYMDCCNNSFWNFRIRIKNVSPKYFKIGVLDTLNNLELLCASKYEEKKYAIFENKTFIDSVVIDETNYPYRLNDVKRFIRNKDSECGLCFCVYLPDENFHSDLQKPDLNIFLNCEDYKIVK